MKSIYLQRDRQKNAVDELYFKIAGIQKKCRHNFRLFEETEPEFLEKSKIKDIFVGECGRRLIERGLQCLKCNFRTAKTVKEICFLCLGKMEKRGDPEPREKYCWGTHPGYDSQLYVCRDCNFSAVVDTWHIS